MELVRLPSPPHILNKLLDLCRDPDSSIDSLAELIGSDVALTAKLIMAVNASAFAISQAPANLQQAIKLVGHEQVKTMVQTSSIQQLFAGLIPSQNEFVCNAWLDSFYCALFARDIAVALNFEHPPVAYLAGLLHDLGQIAFDSRFHKQYVKILDENSEAETISKEVSKFGLSHAELGASILEQWPSLSPAIADAARFHHESEKELKGCDVLCQVVAEASELAWHWSRNGKADNKWQSNLVDEADLGNIYMHVTDKAVQTSDAFGIPRGKSTSLTRDLLCKDIEKETLRFARKIRDSSLMNLLSCEQTQAAVSATPRNLLLKIAREMQLLFSITDVALLYPDGYSGEYLNLHELDHAHPGSKFPVDISDSQVMRSYRDKTSTWIEPEKLHGEISPLSDRQIIRRLKHEIGLCLPLASGDQVIGSIVIGTSKAQKSHLENLSRFISGYLNNIAEQCLKSSRDLQQQAIDGDAEKEQEQNDIDKLVHEISNPLSVIGNYIDIIKMNSKSDGAENDAEIKILKEELQRIGNIVMNFKDAKNAGSQSVFLNDELKTCIPLYVKSTGDGKAVHVNWNLDKAEAEAGITRDSLRQVVLNLVKNAVEAQAEAAEITVSSHHFVNIDGAAFAQFTIADRGDGVDAKTRELLFSPITSSKEGFSRGLGLSVVADILASFDGKIKYLQNESGGASFEVLIPLLPK